MSSTIFLEGGGASAELNIRCREGFKKLLAACGFKDRLPRLVACGSRRAAFERFRTELARGHTAGFMALWIGSEEPVTDINATWAHLKARKDDGWDRPNRATDKQVLFMTTCMETWIVADRATLADHFGADLQESALPPLQNLEERPRDRIQETLSHATRSCKNPYAKGKR